ncbi:MAG: cytochrome C oxidase subunit IV family protein [Pirellulales bacterium]|nr:cytochrome C oxidase subunit IV family protein [Pirellulales bacterium]
MMESTVQAASENALDDSVSSVAHVVPIRVLYSVFFALMVLTAITVAVSYFDFGVFNLWVALGVASIKTTLVALYFMHLRYDHPFHALIFVIGIAFLGLFLAITMLDTVHYQPEIQRWQEHAR